MASIRYHVALLIRSAALISLCCFPGNLLAAELIPGDQVEFITETKLSFYDNEHSVAPIGSKHLVLATNAQKGLVYLESKDAQGKQIALSAPILAVRLVSQPLPDLQKAAVAAIAAEDFPGSKRIVQTALRTNPGNIELATLLSHLTNIENAQVSVNLAAKQLTDAEANAEKMKKSADVVDRPNALNKNDTSNQSRARKIRQEADSLVRAATENQENAKDAYKDALAALKRVSDGYNAAQKALEREKQVAIQEKEQTKGREQNRPPETSEEVRSLMNENPGVPPGLYDEIYYEALEAINNRTINDGWKGLKYGEKSKKMIGLSFDGRSHWVVLFQLSDLTPTVVTTVSEQRYLSEYSVTIQCQNARKRIKRIGSDGSVQDFSELRFYVSKETDIKKVAEALSTLIEMGGGKKEIFDGTSIGPASR